MVRTKIVYACPRADDARSIIAGGTYAGNMSGVEDAELYAQVRKYVTRQNRALANKGLPWRISLAEIDLKFVLPKERN